MLTGFLMCGFMWNNVWFFDIEQLKWRSTTKSEVSWGKMYLRLLCQMRNHRCSMLFGACRQSFLLVVCSSTLLSICLCIWLMVHGFRLFIWFWIHSITIVSGLSYQTDDHNLKEAFSSFGEVTEGECVQILNMWHV